MRQAEAPLPVFEHKNFPVDIHISIYNSYTGYKIKIVAFGQAIGNEISITHHDLQELNSSLQNAMNSIVTNNPYTEPITTKDIQEKDIQEKDALDLEVSKLIEEGHFVFSRIFSDVQTEMQRLTSVKKRLTIQIAADDFSIPWELLYSASLSDPLSYENFWGMKHIIFRVISKRQGSGYFVSPTILYTSKPRFGLLTYLSLHSVATIEVPFFHGLHNHGIIDLCELQSLDSYPHKKTQEIDKIKRFFNNHFDVTHFACHAEYINGQAHNSYILLTEEFGIKIIDFENYEIKISGHPLVIMNACTTGEVHALYNSSFARVFIERGAVGLVATQCTVPDCFAADFAKKIYQYLLKGQLLAVCLLNTRRYFLKKYNNPTGLLYTMYGPPHIQLTREGDGHG